MIHLLCTWKGNKLELINGEFKFEHIPEGKYRIISNLVVGYYSIYIKSGEVVELKIGLGYDE